MKSKLLQTVLVCLALCSVLITTACPKSDQVRSAAKASYRVGGITNDLILKITEARQKNLISQDLARDFGDHLNKIAKAEVAFVQAVKVADAIYRKTGQVPPDQLSILRTIFDDEIVSPFLKVGENFKLLSPTASAAIQAAFVGLRVVLTTIGTGFGSSMLNLIKSAGGIVGAVADRTARPGRELAFIGL